MAERVVDLGGYETPLSRVRAARIRLEVAVAEAVACTRERDDFIRDALAHGYPVGDVAVAAGVTPMRIYQIRDHR